MSPGAGCSRWRSSPRRARYLRACDGHEHALQLAERCGFSFYDAVIVASELLAGCLARYTKDMQDGQRIEGRLLLRDPFRH